MPPKEFEVWGYSPKLDCIVLAAMQEETAVKLIEKYPNEEVIYFFAHLETPSI